MKMLKVKMANCYGIKQLETEFDFKDSSAYAIYAPNGAMKSSFAKTFKDASEGTKSEDRVFPNRTCVRSLTDENDVDIPSDAIFVVTPYDEEFGHSEKTSTLLVNNELRREYEQLHIEIDKAEDALLTALKKQSGSRKDLRQEISSTFTSDEHSFQTALRRIREEVTEIRDTPWADIAYDTIFDDKVITMLGGKNVKLLLQEYMNKYNELLNKSTYFKKGVFNYYNASTIAKSLADNGFFSARHVVRLNAEEPREIKNEKELEELISKEKEAITNDATLRKTYLEIEKLLNKNAQCRDFEAYLTLRPELLPRLENVKSLKEDIWKSYIKTHETLYIDLLDKIQLSEKRKKEIEKQAEKERTQWEDVIEIFNDRFFVPFTLVAQNRTAVLLGHESLLDLGFVFNDGKESMEVPRGTLLQVLSTGEKKALYILNIIFEVEARKKAGVETVFIFDDIADSFDYKNKYAIIQYMQDISNENNFNQIILTHNFDFFRTVASRFVKYSKCLMTLKGETKIELNQAVGIKNIFMNDWKVNFFKDSKKRIASIPFMRNILEYTKGEADISYLKLTSLLHCKTDTNSITIGDLDAIYALVFGHTSNPSPNANEKVIDLIKSEAQDCLNASSGFNFENKIVLAVAIRLTAEQFMIDKINDPTFLESITHNQAHKLFSRFRGTFPQETASIQVLHKVNLMTPENIHLNSFMYEPILDMSDEHLRRLYKDVCGLV